MAHFAEIKNNIVVRVIVAEQDFIDSGAVGNPKNWIQTSYNTHGGKHDLGGIPLRMNYAGVGHVYDKNLDAFIAPQPYPSWILDKRICLWQAPKIKPEEPNNGKYWSWDESKIDWVLK